MSSSEALINLRRRNRSAIDRFGNEVNVARGRYQKAILNSNSIVLRAQNLLNSRRNDERIINDNRKAFAKRTETVLSKETLGFLKDLVKNTAAPSFLGIFTGYEMARADRAARAEKLLDQQERSIERLQEDQKFIFEQRAQTDRAILSAENSLFTNSVDVAGDKLSEDLKTARQVTGDIVDIQQDIQEQKAKRDLEIIKQNRLDKRQDDDQAFDKELEEFRQKSQNEREGIKKDARIEVAEIRGEQARETEAARASNRTELEKARQTNRVQLAEKNAELRKGASSQKSTQSIIGEIEAKTGGSSNKPSVSGGIDKIIQDAANEFGVDPDLLRRVGNAESGLRNSLTSDAGAQGIFQVMPDTAKEVAKEINLTSYDPFNEKDNIRVGAKYLANMIQRYGSVELGLAAYNAGPGAVDKYNGVPPFNETKNYLTKILDGYEPPEPPPTAKAVEKQAEEAVETAPVEELPTQEDDEQASFNNEDAALAQQAAAEHAADDAEDAALEAEERAAQIADEIANQEDPEESARVMLQETMQANDNLTQQVAQLSEQPTLEEMQAIIEESDDEQSKSVLRAIQLFQQRAVV